MSAGARRVWDRLIEDMDPLILRRSDSDALASLAEDEALLAESYVSLRKMAEALRKKALAGRKTLPAGALGALMTTTSGRLTLSAIRDLANRLVIERREFGLSPSSRSRVIADKGDSFETDFDDAVFNRAPELLTPPRRAN